MEQSLLFMYEFFAEDDSPKGGGNRKITNKFTCT